jgi:hypothetical protein
MVTMPHIALLALAVAASQGCVAMSSMGRADVNIRDGQICFSIDRQHGQAEMADIHALAVSGPKGAPVDSVRGGPYVWSFWVAKQGPKVKLAPGQCVFYGVAPVSGIDEKVPPQPLRPRAVYTVFLNGRQPSAKSTLGYDAEFCVAFDDAGKPQRVAVVPPGLESDTGRYQVCDTL